MNELEMDIADAIVHGELSNDQIAKLYGVDVSYVEEVERALYEEFDDSMDGDHASALASAGFGTDEDYGCYDSF